MCEKNNSGEGSRDQGQLCQLQEEVVGTGTALLLICATVYWLR